MSDGEADERTRDAGDAGRGASSSEGEKGRGADGDGGEDGGGAAEDARKPSVFKRPLFWIIVVAVAAALLIGGTLYYLHARQFESTDDAFVDTHIVRISAQSAGRLVAVADVDNRHVRAGRLLAVIEPSGPQAQLAEARANVVQAQAQVDQARAQVSAAIAAREQAAAAARVPLAQAEKAQADLARYRTLLRLDPAAVAGQQLDQARAQARATAADAAAAQGQVRAADAQVTVAARQVRSAEAAVGARRAQVSQANTTLNDLRIVAPVAGQVVNRQVNLGSYVQAGSQLLAIVPEAMWITANFKETQLAAMRVGQPVTIKVDAYPDVKFVGHVDSIQRGAGQAFALLPPQNATGNYVKVVQRVPVRILFDVGGDRPDPRRYPIGPGMSVVPTVKVR